MPTGPRWWQKATFYQIYVRSWRDGNGDGTGDLPGVIEGLDYLSWLGVDAIWLSPTMPSPDADWGYDVSDYKGVHPELGTMADLDRLVQEAGRRHIAVLLDLVPNHTSSAHPWFVDALSGPRLSTAGTTYGPGPSPMAAPPTTGPTPLGRRRGPWTRPAASTTSTTTSQPSPTSTGGTSGCTWSSRTSSAFGS